MLNLSKIAIAAGGILMSEPLQHSAQVQKWAGRFGISTSIAMLATSAMAHAGTEGQVRINSDLAVSDDVKAQIDATLGKKSVREAVNGAFGILVKNFENQGTTLEEKYLKSSGIVVATSAPTSLGASDPNIGAVDTCYQNCYGNCHGACHGSRGWR